MSRRTALAATAAALTATGCGVDDGGPPTAGTDPPTEPGVDLRLLREALRREQQLEDRVVSLRGDRATLRTLLQGVAAVHRDHLDLLQRSAPDDGEDEVRLRIRSARPRPAAGDQVRRLAAAERRLAQAYADAALAARSGPFARVLAGMAAAADQQAHLLDSLAGTGPRGG